MAQQQGGTMPADGLHCSQKEGKNFRLNVTPLPHYSVTSLASDMSQLNSPSAAGAGPRPKRTASPPILKCDVSLESKIGRPVLKRDLSHEGKADPPVLKRDLSHEGRTLFHIGVANTPRGGENKKKARQEPTTLTFSNIEKIGTLGAGSFGVIELVRLSTDYSRTFAMKNCCVSSEDNAKHAAQLQNEQNLLATTQHPFIIELVNSVQNPEGGLCLLLDHASGGDLMKRLKRLRSQGQRGLTDSAIAFYAAQLADAFSYLHSKSIVHRDFKPENILLDKQGYVKLSDFGMAKQLPGEGGSEGGGRTFTFVGSPAYMSPEIITKKGTGVKADCWAFGVVMFELATMKLLMCDAADPANHAKTFTNALLSRRRGLPFPAAFAQERPLLVRMMSALLAFEQTDRLGMGECLQQELLQRVDMRLLRARRLPVPA